LTEVNESHNGNEDNEEQAPVAASVAVLLTATADLIMGRGLPEPVRVDVSAGSGLDVELASHVDMSAWSAVLGLRRWPWSSQPYVADGVLCQLTNVYGRWRDARVRVHCLEPVDALAALRDQGQP